MEAISIINSQDTLGEGPVWSGQEQALYWIDIKAPSIQRWVPATGAHDTWAMPAEIGCFSLREQGGAVVALQTGIAFYDFDAKHLEPIIDPEADKPSNRFNDGKCDRRGRFWTGTMDNEEKDFTLGALYRINPDRGVTKVRAQVGISNGLGWSPDNKVMYYADSPAKVIYAFDFDIETGEARNERIFAEIIEGVPDGLTVDSEGYVWNAQWDAWRVTRYAPDGTVDRIVRMPVQRPTSCMFGGPDLKDLFVTSASIHLTPSQKHQQPEAGNVFAVKTDVAGLPEPRFAG